MSWHAKMNTISIVFGDLLFTIPLLVLTLEINLFVKYFNPCILKSYRPLVFLQNNLLNFENGTQKIQKQIITNF